MPKCACALHGRPRRIGNTSAAHADSSSLEQVSSAPFAIASGLAQWHSCHGSLSRRARNPADKYSLPPRPFSDSPPPVNPHHWLLAHKKNVNAPQNSAPWQVPYAAHASASNYGISKLTRPAVFGSSSSWCTRLAGSCRHATPTLSSCVLSVQAKCAVFAQAVLHDRGYIWSRAPSFIKMDEGSWQLCSYKHCQTKHLSLPDAHHEITSHGSQTWPQAYF